MRHTLFALPLLAATAASGAQTGETQIFGDWIVGCDNTLSCTAIGLSPETAAAFAYLKIAREAGPDTQPALSVSVLDEMSSGGPLRLELAGGALAEDVPTAEDDGSSLATARLGASSRTMMEALLPGETLNVTIGRETVPVSLTGMSAALRYMDAAQERAGTALALVAKGERPEDTVPSAPATPTVPALALREIDAPAERPDGLPEPDEYCPEGAGDTVFKAPDGTLIWGVCISSGAYNLISDFWIVGNDAAVPADLGLQGAGIHPDGGDMGSSLVNATLMEDGRTIQTFFRGRGLGDCGTITAFVFDGQALRLVQEAGMGECRGVQPDDWPVTYRASIESR